MGQKFVLKAGNISKSDIFCIHSYSCFHKLSGCGGLVTGLKGSFHSPNFPGKYPPEKTCSWKISVPEGYIIQMKFIRFHLEKHSICKYDSVVIKDGWERKSPLLGRYCDVNPIRSK